jgi:hypothetical protein
MKKIILAVAAVALLSGPPLASAAFGENGDPPTHADRPSMTERAALFGARLIGFQAPLKLTADQQKNWPAFETALRSVAKDRADRFRARHAREDDDEQPTLIDRLNGISDRLAKRSTEIKLVAEAAAPLYSSLDDEQKLIFSALLRDLAREGRHGAHHWR